MKVVVEAAAAALDADRADDRTVEAYVGVHVRGTQGGRGLSRLCAARQSTRAKLLCRWRGTAVAYRRRGCFQIVMQEPGLWNPDSWVPLVP